MAYNCLTKIELNEQIQNALIPIYSIGSIQDKIQILAAFEGSIKLVPELLACFSKDLTVDNDWLQLKLKKY